MKVAVSGYRDGEKWPALGAELVVPDAEGAGLCAQGYAEPVVEARAEKAVPRQRSEKR